ncbi:hypothetical protein I4U23_008850 [Adineta vaga]|nr:hypothetical protein I4U23_008850 [Adineta vaga]
MNRLRNESVEESQRLVSKRQSAKATNEVGDDDIFLDDETNDDHQASIRRRAPTRHSIKSLSGRKTAAKQTATTSTTTTTTIGAATTTEASRKAAKNNPPPPINKSNENKILYNVPSVSQIAPLPQNKSHGILPVLSLDGRDAPNPMQSETSENDLTINATTPNTETIRQPHRICLDPTTRRQYSYSQSSVLSEGIEPGIYSTSLVNNDKTDVTTTYHPLTKQIKQHQLTVQAPTAYNYRSRTNSNIIERRFSNVDQPMVIPELICK